MDDILALIRHFLGWSWDFLMHTYIPGTRIAFGVMFVGLCVISIGFRFLSLAIGHSIGDVGGFAGIRSTLGYGASGSNDHKISDARKDDVR